MTDPVAEYGIRTCTLCRKRMKTDPIVVDRPGVTCRPCGARLLLEEAPDDHNERNELT